MTMSLVAMAGTSASVRAMTLDRAVAVSPSLVMNTPSVSLVPDDTAAPALTDTGQDDPAGTNAAAPEFASLADAVAAQDSIAESDDLRCLAGAVYFESKGEPLPGQLAVAQVILNRAKSGRFPTDLCSVVKQRGQFSFVRDGEIPAVDTARTAYRTAIAVAKVALAKAWAGGSASQALFFNATGRAPGHALRIAAIGGHVFYR